MAAHQQRLIVAAGLVWLSPRLLLWQRRATTASHGGGCLEMPGGKVEHGEAPTAALLRELGEEWGSGAKALRIGPVADILHHIYPPPGPEVLLCVYHVDARAWGDDWEGQARPEPGTSLEAYPIGRLPLPDFLDADRPFVGALQPGACPF